MGSFARKYQLIRFVLVGFLFVNSGNALASEPADQVQGYYADGSLRLATPLPREGHGFFHLFHVRDRFWGSEGLVGLIENVAAEIANEYPDGERLQVGDLSAEKGGQITLHASHQNGLDTDFVYFRTNRREQGDDPAKGFTEQFVVKGRLSKNFDLERNWRLFQLLVESGRVQRMFVDPVIKNTYCRRFKKSAEAIQTLRRMRPLSNHGDHVHVRLTCPAESPDCLAQEEVPAGSGC